MTGVCDGSGSLRGGRGGARGAELPGGRAGPPGLQELGGKVLARYRAGGLEALEPRSRAPRTIPHRTPVELEDEIFTLRKELADLGVDAGAATIAYHLALRHEQTPSVSTIWRVLRRRGFVTPQPHKRPRSSWARFEADPPNECWQSDVTHWHLSDGVEVEIINLIDYHSRFLVASMARVVLSRAAPPLRRIARTTAGTRYMGTIRRLAVSPVER